MGFFFTEDERSCNIDSKSSMAILRVVCISITMQFILSCNYLGSSDSTSCSHAMPKSINELGHLRL